MCVVTNVKIKLDNPLKKLFMGAGCKKKCITHRGEINHNQSVSFVKIPTFEVVKK